MKIQQLIPDYLEELKLINRSIHTITNTKNILKQLILFLETKEVYGLNQLGGEILLLYQEELLYRLTAKGKQLSVRTREKHLCTIRGFLNYLYEKDYLAVDLCKVIKLPKQPKPLPKVILDESEIKKLLLAPDMQTNDGYRNRIMLEILYDTGIRAAEMAAIKTRDLDLTNGYLTVRSGKGDKDRVVPINSRVCELIQQYLLMIRPCMVKGKDDGYLVLNKDGNGMTPHAVWAIVKRCTKLSGLKKNITTHTFRHTCATHMLKNGAPIRHIQELLGHESLESTMIYTKVTINDLKEIHAKYHPSESL
jgi:integrase/recombinase XerD